MGNLESGSGTMLHPLRFDRVQIADNHQRVLSNRGPEPKSRTNLTSRNFTSLIFESSVPPAKTMRIVHSVLDHKPQLFIRMLPIFIQSMLSRRQGAGSLDGCARSIRGKGAETP